MVYYDWVQNARRHRTANSLPTPENFELLMNDQLCQQLPPEWCEHDDAAKTDRPWVNVNLSFADIVSGAKAYLSFALSGFKSVDQSEADRRARICSGCFLRVPIQGCGACNKMGTLITGSLAQKRTAYDDRLKNKACAPCKCPVQSIVHFPLSLLSEKDADKQDVFPEFCWRRVGSLNYAPA